MKGFRWALACMLMLAGLPAAAHEFWLMPKNFTPPQGSAVALTLRVGEFFEGSLVGFTADHAAALRRYAQDGMQDLRNGLSGSMALPEFPLPIARAGAQVIAFDSAPSSITLAPDKFHAYLHDEGLDAVIRQREAAGAASVPGRERYRRCVKTLLRGGGKTDATGLISTGQRLEILPLADPHTRTPGDALHFKLLFDQQPLTGALVKAWHKHDGQLVLIRARSGPDGQVHFTLPYAGTWMMSVVHMVAAAEGDEADWESFWGNLSFALPTASGD